MPSDLEKLEIRVREDGKMVLQRDHETNAKTFETIADVLAFLRAHARKKDSRLSVYGYDGRKLVETTI